MLLLFETPAGFALFKVLDEGKLSKVEVFLVGTLFVIPAAWYSVLTLFSFFFLLQDLGKEFSTPDSARQVLFLDYCSYFC